MLSWQSHTYSGSGANGDLGGGGAEDLQTDVMRFMAMLALCLVAIFALVQSLPMRLEAPDPTPPPKAAPVKAAPAKVTPPSPAPVTHSLSPSPPLAVERAVRPAPEPVAATVRESDPVVAPSASAARPRQPAVRPPAPTPPPKAAASSPPRRSPEALTPPLPVAVQTQAIPPADPPTPDSPPEFTLRFSSDSALLTLVKGGSVTLYAVDGQGTSRLDGRAPRLLFRAAPAPAAMHDMDPASVPSAVRTAYLRSRGAPDAQVQRWGVVLPAETLSAIDKLLADPRGGELRIAANGGVTLEATAP